MNSNTLWLQVPAAKRQSKYLVFQDADYPSLGKINIILFFAKHSSNHCNISLSQTASYRIQKEINNRKNILDRLLPHFKPKLELINLSPKDNLNKINGVMHSSLKSSVNDFWLSPAMSEELLADAMNIGRQSAQRIKRNGNQLFIASEINQGNTLSAMTLSCVLLNIKVDSFLDVNEEQNKFIQQALSLHKVQLTSEIEILRHLGDFEIAALTGSYLCCAHMGLPILVNSFASAVAAFITSKICKNSEHWFLYSQAASNKAHQIILEKLKAKPLLKSHKSGEDFEGIVAALSHLDIECARYNDSTDIKGSYKLNAYS